MGLTRRPFQGVWNIIRFNRHFYLWAIGLILCLFLLKNLLGVSFHLYLDILSLLILGPTTISLLTSFYVYDLSGLYKMEWLEGIPLESKNKMVNIHAGFDETSAALREKFPDAEWLVFDFYDHSKHTEISIQRARKALPPLPDTREVSTHRMPLENNCVDAIFVILAAHEIRKASDRHEFFRELARILKRNGKIIVAEHLRNVPNFLTYNIGFFHFFSEDSWYRLFKKAGLKVDRTIGITPFIKSFVLQKHGTSS